MDDVNLQDLCAKVHAGEPLSAAEHAAWYGTSCSSTGKRRKKKKLLFLVVGVPAICSSRPWCSPWTRSLCPCCATTGAWSDSAENRAGAAVAVHRRSTASLRAAKANPHGPACSENHRDSSVAVGQVVDAPVVQVVPCPLSFRQVLMVQTLQKTVGVPQMQLFSGCRRRCEMQRQVPGSAGRCLRPVHRQDVQVLRRGDFAAFCGIFRTPSGWT